MRISVSFTLVLLGVSVQNILCQDDTAVSASGGPGGVIGRMFGSLLTFLSVGDLEDVISSVTSSGEDQREGGKEKEGEKGENSNNGDSGSLLQNVAENMKFITCTTETTCFNDSTQTPGAWTCRSQLVGEMSVCIPTILGVTVGREGETNLEILSGLEVGERVAIEGLYQIRSSSSK